MQTYNETSNPDKTFQQEIALLLFSGFGGTLRPGFFREKPPLRSLFRSQHPGWRSRKFDVSCQNSIDHVGTENPVHPLPVPPRRSVGPKPGRLYENSFPACERWNGNDYDRAFTDPLFEADAIRYDGRFAGILFHWKGDGFHYVEHLAISPLLRGQNMGSRAWRPSAKGVASSWRSTRPKTKFRSGGSTSTSGWDSSPIPTHTSTPRSGALPASPAGADEPPGALSRRRGTPFRRLHPRTGPALPEHERPELPRID